MSADTTVERLKEHVGREVRVRGWLYHGRRKGKVAFLVVRDGTGLVQCVGVKGDLDDATFESLDRIPQESSLEVTGTVRADDRAPGGAEIAVKSVKVVHEAEPYPITPKEHGVDFLM